MKIVVIGGTGLIGSKLVSTLQRWGHDVIAASPKSGVDTLTGEGLAAALNGAQVVVDVSNSPSFADAEVLKFFQTSTSNLLAAEAQAGVAHHVALSIVGADRLPDSGYLRAKVAQENLIKAGPIPYTLLRSTQFFEFIDRIAQAASDSKQVRVSSALLQPVLSDDVVKVLANLAVGLPMNATVEVAGPDRLRTVDLVEHVLRASGDTRDVIADPGARYFGAELNDQSLVAGPDARIGGKHFAVWLTDALSAQRPAKAPGASATIR